MDLLKRFQAKSFAKRLRDSGSATLGETKSQLVSLGAVSIRAMLDALHDPLAREAALDVLSQLCSNATLQEYLDAIGNADPIVSDAAAHVLARSENYEPTRLLPLFADARVSKARLEQVLMARAGAIPAKTLLAVLPDLSKDARGGLIRLLEKHADESIVPDLINLSRNTDWWVRLHAARLLARFPSTESIDAMIALANDENRGVRLEAVGALARLGAVAAIPALCEALRDNDLKVHTAAINALIQIGDPSAVPHLLNVLKDESEVSRRGAVEVLNEVATVDAIRDLVLALHDADWWVRVRAADALGTLGGPKVVEAVIGLLDDPDDFARRYAVEILNTVHDLRAVEPLIHALDDEDWWVRERAIDALAKTHDSRAVNPIIELMWRDPRAVPLCIKALSEIKDPRAIDPLCRLARSESAEVRREALHALVNFSREKALSEDARAQVMETLNDANVPIDRKSGRPMEVRGRRGEFGPETGRTGTGSRGVPGVEHVDPHSGSNAPDEPAVVHASAAPSTPATPNNAQFIDYQSMAPGTRLLDRYDVIRRIGGGGFGAVYLVEDVVVREELVLKVLSPQLSMDERMIRRFVQELKFTRRIAHPNVIRIYDLINLGGAHAISMEYFAGRDLGDVIKEDGPLPAERVMKIALQVCEGLAAAHEKGIIHRDIKPPNILIGKTDETKIVDFGLAVVGEVTGSRLTKSGILVGTPEYIAPEQITSGESDARADLYSFGVVMYEMLSGRQPFTGGNAVNVLFQHLEGEVETLIKVAPTVPADLALLVMKTMSRFPNDRPASANELLQSLRALTI